MEIASKFFAWLRIKLILLFKMRAGCDVLVK